METHAFQPRTHIYLQSIFVHKHLIKVQSEGVTVEQDSWMPHGVLVSGHKNVPECNRNTSRRRWGVRTCHQLTYHLQSGRSAIRHWCCLITHYRANTSHSVRERQSDVTPDRASSESICKLVHYLVPSSGSAVISLMRITSSDVMKVLITCGGSISSADKKNKNSRIISITGANKNRTNTWRR